MLPFPEPPPAPSAAGTIHGDRCGLARPQVATIKSKCEEDARRIAAEKDSCMSDLAKAQPFVDQVRCSLVSPSPLRAVRHAARLGGGSHPAPHAGTRSPSPPSPASRRVYRATAERAVSCSGPRFLNGPPTRILPLRRCSAPQADKAISSIKPAHIQEVKKLPNPADVIKMVFDCILLLFHSPVSAPTPPPTPPRASSARAHARDRSL